MRLRLLLIVTVVASLFLAAPFVASALGPTYKSVVNIRATKPVFHGRVHLRNAGQHPGVAKPCRTHRRVTLFRRTPSTGGSKGDVKRMGRTRTNRRGRWVIHPSPILNGKYYALAKRRVLPKKGNKVCDRQGSRRIQIG